jgi:predicted O-methyltransferase YrrM
MIGMRKIELFYEPLDIINNNDLKCEMTNYELAFLCGVLRYKKPRKIVEVGVSYGGTTCVILECLRRLDYKVEMHSVDISKDYYRNPSKKTGTAVDEVFGNIPDNIEHHWHLGCALPEALEDIGTGIDVIVLDTVHTMPGEMLDFLAAFHFLSKNAVVVLHDIILNHLSDSEFGYATKIVYDVVVADKIIADGIDYSKIYLNIGAFEINDDTEKYIERCFSALTITWKYILEGKYMELYRAFYQKRYEDYLIEMFDIACTLNIKRAEKESKKKQFENEQMVRFHEIAAMQISENCMDSALSDRLGGYKLVLYGAGEYAVKIGGYLEEIGHKCDAYIISDGESVEKCKIKENVYNYSQLPYLQEECNVIFAVNSYGQQQIIKKIADNHFHEIFSGDFYLYDRLLEYIDDYMKYKDYRKI